MEKTISCKSFITGEIQGSVVHDQNRNGRVLYVYTCAYIAAGLHWHGLLLLESEPLAPDQVRDLLIKIYIKQTYIQNT